MAYYADVTVKKPAIYQQYQLGNALSKLFDGFELLAEAVVKEDLSRDTIFNCRSLLADMFQIYNRNISNVDCYRSLLDLLMDRQKQQFAKPFLVELFAVGQQLDLISEVHYL